MEQSSNEWSKALPLTHARRAPPQHSTAFALGYTHPWAMEQLRKFGNKRCILVDGTHGALLLASSGPPRAF